MYRASDVGLSMLMPNGVMKPQRCRSSCVGEGQGEEDAEEAFEEAEEEEREEEEEEEEEPKDFTEFEKGPRRVCRLRGTCGTWLLAAGTWGELKTNKYFVTRECTKPSD